jgi:hypothetical protein
MNRGGGHHSFWHALPRFDRWKSAVRAACAQQALPARGPLPEPSGNRALPPPETTEAQGAVLGAETHWRTQGSNLKQKTGARH